MQNKTGVLKEFKDFLMQGNLIELAVAVVIGTAFGAVIASLVADLLTPLIAAIFGKQDFSALTFTINGSEFSYGNFINALIAFVMVAAAIFFAVIKPYNKLRAMRAKEEEAAPPAEDIALLTEIRDLLKK